MRNISKTCNTLSGFSRWANVESPKSFCMNSNCKYRMGNIQNKSKYDSDLSNTSLFVLMNSYAFIYTISPSQSAGSDTTKLNLLAIGIGDVDLSVPSPDPSPTANIHTHSALTTLTSTRRGTHSTA